MLYRIRYILSKLGRVLNLRENTKDWLKKDNVRLKKRIMKVNPNFEKLINTKKMVLINMDSDKNKSAKMQLHFMFKKIVVNWK